MLSTKQSIRSRCYLFFCFLAFLTFAPKLFSAEPFENVTEAVGLSGMSGDVAAWGDFNGDGWVDFAVGGQLWKNDSGQRFERVADVAFAGAGIWGDVDNDGDLDFFCWGATGRIYRNQDGKTFEEIEAAVPELPTKVSLGATWGDFDGDGYLFGLGQHSEPVSVDIRWPDGTRQTLENAAIDRVLEVPATTK